MAAVDYQDVSHAFATGTERALALENVTLQVPQGSCLSLLGANGSGKSTLLRMACGLLRPRSGRVRVLGVDPLAHAGVRGSMGIVFDGARSLYARLTPRENFDYACALRGTRPRPHLQRHAQLCEAFGVAACMGQPMQTLSRGTQQKFAVISAIALPVALWVLDEPTLGLDADSVQALQQLLADHTAAGGTALLATHELDFAERAGAVVDVRRFHAAATGDAHPRGSQVLARSRA